MPLKMPARVVRALIGRGCNARRKAVALIIGSDDPGRTFARVVEAAPDDTLRVTADHIREMLVPAPIADPSGAGPTPPAVADATNTVGADPAAPAVSGLSVSVATSYDNATHTDRSAPAEAQGTPGGQNTDLAPRPLEITNDMTGQSTGTDGYDDFVKMSRDCHEKLSRLLHGCVNHHPAKAISNMSDGEDVELIGLVDDMRSTKSGHWTIDLEGMAGTLPCFMMEDKDIVGYVDKPSTNGCIVVQGMLSGDAGILSVDSMHSPDVPRNHHFNAADRDVQAMLIFDAHVGSQEFMTGMWNRSTDWFHTEEITRIEYLLIVGGMIGGVGVYLNQNEEPDAIDIYEQYEAFPEYLKPMSGDLEIVMIPGNHDMVRLAEPQPGFDDELHDIMSAHDARITSNPSVVMLEDANVLMYHGASFDEVIAELPANRVSYDESHKAMHQLLKKRYVVSQFGSHIRLASEELNYLIIEDAPDIFHTGHAHKSGWGKYYNVLAVNSGCWQIQIDFQKSVNVGPDADYASAVNLGTLNMTVRKLF